MPVTPNSLMSRHPRSWFGLLIAILVVVTLASILIYILKPSPTGSITTGLYQFWSKNDRVNPNADFIIIKGEGLPSPTHANLINYEQAFALNSSQASAARSKGYLALTCDGQEIHPGNIPGVTLLNAELPAAVDWRSSAIAEETNAHPEAGTYLDTLRPVFNASFYDGTPCNYTDSGWRSGSVELVDQVRAKTGGKMVLANGVGMGSGRAYFKYQDAVDDFFERAKPEAVQIEHFARSSGGARFDADFIKALAGKGIIPFAKCDGSTSACQTAFMTGVDEAAATGTATKAYATVPAS